ncbi:PP2C family serine/threonine-protein phosphatase [Streptomyces phaeofaciens]|uniref:PP2C family serine/threonine-protein phosphatase n=1 Tax=Streptomyces phaeofaciens TaxID=68254 RepID=UPI00367C8988
MSQQGGRPTGHEDDWWGQLYDDSTADTGPAPTADSLDDRFASASGAVRSAGPDGETGAGPGEAGPGSARAGGAVPEPRAANPVPGGPTDADWWRARDTAPGAPPAQAAVPPPRGPSGTPGGAADERDTRPGTGWDAGPGTGWDAEAGIPPAPAPGAPPLPSTPAATPRPPVPERAPWEPPPDTPPGPTTFPQGPLPSGFSGSAPSPPAASVPAPPQTPPAVPLAPTASAVGTATPAAPAPEPARTTTALDLPTLERAPEGAPKAYVGSGPPTYDAEPTALPAADPDDLDDLVADTVLDGARYGACALRAASVRGDSARYRGEPRRDSLLTARFGTGDQALVLVAMATGARATPGAHRAAAEACQWIGRAVGRSHVRLAEDMRAARRGDLKSGLHRLTDRSLGRLRASAAEQGLEPDEYAATLRCLLLPADPECRTRVFFGVGPGGLFRLRAGEWQDLEPRVGEIAGGPVVGFGSLPAETPEGDRLTMDLGITTPPNPYEEPPEPPREPFRFRASVARPGDTLLMCTGGLAEPLRGEPELSTYLTGQWSGPNPPGLAAFLADTQVRVKGYADDRTAAAVWEA